MARSALVLLAVLLAGCPSAPPAPPFAARLLRGHEAAILGVACSPDGRFVVSSASDGTFVWDLETSRKLDVQAPGASSIAFSQDGLVATGHGDSTVALHGPVVVGEAFFGAPTRYLQAGEPATARVRFTPDGSLLSWDKGAILWDREKLEARVRIRGAVAAVSSDARIVVLARDAVRVVETSSGREIAVVSSKAAEIGLSPDGTLLALGAKDGTIVLHSTAGGRELARVSGAGPVEALLFSPDSRSLVVSTGESSDRLLEVPSLQERRRLAWKNGNHAFSPDSRLLASVIGFQWIVVEETATGRELACLWGGKRKDAYRLVFSPDARFLAASCLHDSFGLEGTTRFFSLDPAKCLAEVAGVDVSFSRDGKRVVWARVGDGIVCVADAPP